MTATPWLEHLSRWLDHLSWRGWTISAECYNM